MKISDERWVAALEQLEQYGKSDDLIKALLDARFKDVPIWVRAQLKLWSKGKLPPDPTLPTQYYHIWRAANAYRRSEKRPGEKRSAKIARIAHEYSQANKLEPPVKPRSLEGYLDGGGRAYITIRDYLRPPSARRKDPSVRRKE